MISLFDSGAVNVEMHCSSSLEVAKHPVVQLIIVKIFLWSKQKADSEKMTSEFGQGILPLDGNKVQNNFQFV